jgi:phosphate transport system substrate-binding protein
MAADLDYVPMPDAVKTLVHKLWTDNVKDATGASVASK